MNNNKRGGARSNAGAKPKPQKERKRAVATYHRVCDIELIGGFDVARDTAHRAIENKIKKFEK